MVSVLGAALGGLAIIAATVLEELTHLAAGRPWATTQRLALPECHAIQQFGDDTPRRVDVWVAVAPLLVGLTALGLVVVGRGVPPLSDKTVLFWVAWAWFTTPSLTDLKAAAGESQSDVMTLSDAPLRAVWTGVSIVSVGLLLLYGADNIGAALAPLAPDLAPWVETYSFRAGVWLPLAGVVWTFVRLETDTDHSLSD